MNSSPAGITRLLRAWQNGEETAIEQLAPLVYEELRQIARRRMRQERSCDMLQTTALVNEAYIRLVEGATVDWQDRVHFFAVSAQIMRRILVDAARSRGSEKRGARTPRVTINESIDGGRVRGSDLVALDDALDALAGLDARKARVVELRFFGGLSVNETATVLKISQQSVLRDWKLAKAYLLRTLRNSSS